MVARIDEDVVPVKPQLVLWQTGVNDAIKGVPIGDFKQQLRAGIARFRSLGIDVVLIDQQYSPRFTKLKDGSLYMAALREMAVQNQVPVVQRFAIMQHLIATAQFTTATLLSPDQFHLNDQSYDCMGRLLAKSLESIAAPPVSVTPAKVVVGRDQARM
jgi:lysophospholipase L1-like esterase